MTSDKTRAVILFGGRSSEHEISIRSAASVIMGLDASRYVAIPLAIERSGCWLDSARSVALLPDEAAARCSLDAAEIHHEPDRSRGFDVVFPVLHGPYGEDGRIQGFLDLADVPYVGSGTLGSACAMDKDMAKRVLHDHGIPTLDHMTVRWDQRDDRIKEIEKGIGYPAFVKPANLGSSVGVRRVTDRRGLVSALKYAGEFDDKLLVEPEIDAREIECGVLEWEGLQASVPGEIVTTAGFYDYETKYLADTAELHVPADISNDDELWIQSMAIEAFDALECAGLARVDFFLERDSGRVLINEVNTMPGFTSISMYPRMWEASGLPYPVLLDRLVDHAIARHEQRRRLRFDLR